MQPVRQAAETVTPRPADSVPQAPAGSGAGSQARCCAADGAWWRTLAEVCKGRLSPMYRAFLDMCTGVLEGDTVTVYAPDDITLGRLDNDRVRGVLSEEASNAVGGAVRLMFHVGAPPQASPQENLQNLLKFSSQFDNIQIK